MIVLRFFALLLAFIGVLAGCAMAVLLGILMLRFLPVLIAVVLACMVFWWLLKKAAVRISGGDA
ncbi:MAG: hypothetical protein K2X80_10755 [Pseudomonadaceae bacterium]|nr:hypothetical protein [Pseudomonadaceae bacterium]